jgi:hypothetical protein
MIGINDIIFTSIAIHITNHEDDDKTRSVLMKRNIILKNIVGLISFRYKDYILL